MRQIFGEYPAKSYALDTALPRSARIVFDSWATQPGCYFELIAPYFERFACRDGGAELGSINALMVLDATDLELAITLIDQILEEFSSLPISWRYHQGSEKKPGMSERQIYVILYKRRLLSVVSWLRTVFAGALERDHCVVFGNGVFYRILAAVRHHGSITYS